MGDLCPLPASADSVQKGSPRAFAGRYFAAVTRPRRGLRECSVSGYKREHHALGMCRAHYNRFRVPGAPGPADVRERRARGTVRCSAGACERPAKALGLCRAHYQRLAAHGCPGDDAISRYAPAGSTSCAADGCAEAAHSRGFCKRHYDQQRRARR